MIEAAQITDMKGKTASEEAASLKNCRSPEAADRAIGVSPRISAWISFILLKWSTIEKRLPHNDTNFGFGTLEQQLDQHEPADQQQHEGQG